MFYSFAPIVVFQAWTLGLDEEDSADRETEMRTPFALVFVALALAGCSPSVPAPVMDHPTPAEPESADPSIEVIQVNDDQTAEEAVLEYVEGEKIYAPTMFDLSSEEWTHVMDADRNVSFTASMCGAHGFMAGDFEGDWLFCEAVWDVAGISMNCPFVAIMVDDKIAGMGFLPGPETDESCGLVAEEMPDLVFGDTYQPVVWTLSADIWTSDLKGHPFVATSCMEHHFLVSGEPSSWLFCHTLWPVDSRGAMAECPLLIIERNGTNMAGFIPTDDPDPNCDKVGPDMPTEIDGIQMIMDTGPSPLGPL